MIEKGFNEEFWTALRNLPESKISLHSKAKYNDRNYLDLGYKKGIGYYYTISRQKRQWTVGLYIGFADKSKIKKTFDSLKRYEAEIQSAFVLGELEWTKDNKDRCKILFTKHINDWDEIKNGWKQVQVEMIKTMICFEKSTSTFISKLP